MEKLIIIGIVGVIIVCLVGSIRPDFSKYIVIATVLAILIGASLFIQKIVEMLSPIYINNELIQPVIQYSLVSLMGSIAEKIAESVNQKAIAEVIEFALNIYLVMSVLPIALNIIDILKGYI